MDRNELSDEELLSWSKAGCEASFTVLYRRHQGRVYRFAYAMGGLRELAEEVTQEVFLSLLEKGFGYDAGRGSLAPYLLGVARKRILRWFERNRSAASPGEGGLEAAASDDALAEMTRQETIEEVRRAAGAHAAGACAGAARGNGPGGGAAGDRDGVRPAPILQKATGSIGIGHSVRL